MRPVASVSANRMRLFQTKGSIGPLS